MNAQEPDAADASIDMVLPLPPNAPRVKANAFARWFGRTLLRLGGWRMQGRFPDIPKLVMLGAPHSSNWDGIWAFAAIMAMGLDVNIVAKRELFRWPLGPLLRKLGVIEIDRKAAQGVVEQINQRMRTSERFWLGIAPEGTRKRVEQWKPGFWKIAKAANVPILPVYFHYPERIIGVGPLFETGHDMQADIARIRAWYAPIRGKYRGVE